MACLVLDFEGLDVLTHELIGDAVTVGRAPSNDIVIDHPTVSAQHARLTKSPSGYRIKDLESTNGTQINGVSISDAQLKNGAEIRFGYITGFFRDAAASNPRKDVFPWRAALELGGFVARQGTRKALTTVPAGNAGCASPDAQKSGSGLS